MRCDRSYAFRTGEIPTEMVWSTVVLLPKDDGGVRGIGLVEVIWKVIVRIIYGRIVTLHDSLHVALGLGGAPAQPVLKPS